jgi:phosphatidylserine/phosphatidylglycerophosphate/cardiolipin synthase-like enzyme
MTVTAHVGPEQSFAVLEIFLDGARTSLVSAMYQFFASHVADAVDGRLAANVAMTLVLDPLSRDPKQDSVKPGEFDRSDTFARWRGHNGFSNIYVRKGNGGLVDSAYHIKVTVRDGTAFWLSSGNWTKSSQPLPDPSTRRAAGNREWHVVVENERLATLFARHIEADVALCEKLGATNEAPDEPAILVDVPDAAFDIATEAPVRTLEPLTVSGSIKVKPILTPDRHGRVYTDAVLDLIRSARRQLVFQNQYIKIAKGMAGNLGELVDALVERSRMIDDVRVILRDGDVIDNVTELKRRGMDVMRCVRIVGNTHTKGIVVDGKRVLIGSQNWSGAAVSTNRDASLLFDDARIAGYFLEAFEIDWARARAPSLTPPTRPVRRAERAEPPPGYTRMTLAEYLEA